MGWHHMQAYDIIHMRFFHTASLHHGKCASCSLLCGLEKNFTHPDHSALHSLRMRAAPRAMDTWASWPQACIKPGFMEPVRAGRILRQRQGIHVSPQGHRVSPARSAALNHGCNPRACYRIFVEIPHPSSSSRIRALVHFSSNPGSGWRWKSCGSPPAPGIFLLYAVLYPYNQPFKGHPPSISGHLIKSLFCLPDTVRYRSFRCIFPAANPLPP